MQCGNGRESRESRPGWKLTLEEGKEGAWGNQRRVQKSLEHPRGMQRVAGPASIVFSVGTRVLEDSQSNPPARPPQAVSAARLQRLVADRLAAGCGADPYLHVVFPHIRMYAAVYVCARDQPTTLAVKGAAPRLLSRAAQVHLRTRIHRKP